MVSAYPFSPWNFRAMAKEGSEGVAQFWAMAEERSVEAAQFRAMAKERSEGVAQFWAMAEERSVEATQFRAMAKERSEGVARNYRAFLAGSVGLPDF